MDLKGLVELIDSLSESSDDREIAARNHLEQAKRFLVLKQEDDENKRAAEIKEGVA